MRSLCVFCGSSFGEDPAYQEAARSLGRALAERGMRLVYGGGRVGLMGTIADAALAAGGEVVGVIPKTLLQREIGHEGLSRLHVVGSMHERKALMAQLAGGFVALPGGCGTLEELFEVFTWAQLGMHEKPCGLLNVRGYYDPLLRAFDRMVSAGFLSEERRRTLIVASNPEALLADLDQHAPRSVPRWIGLSET